MPQKGFGNFKQQLKIFKKLKDDEVNSLTKIKQLEVQLEILEGEMEIYDLQPKIAHTTYFSVLNVNSLRIISMI